MERSKKARMMRFIGIVCWFMALFMLFDSHMDKKAQEAEELKQTQIEIVASDAEETGEPSTIIFPED